MDICEKAKRLIQETSAERHREISAFVAQCESPVEQILVVTLYNSWHASINTGLNRLQCSLPALYPGWEGIFDVRVELQKAIWTPLQEYRVDLYMFLTRFWSNSEQPVWGKLVVEIDGHDFHDRTKQQASYDRERDRAITLEGYRVIRFTGSDVFNDPYHCVEDIKYQLNDLANQVFDTYLESNRLQELILGPER
jgi:very-short-patch-repair endonuclease